MGAPALTPAPTVATLAGDDANARAAFERAFYEAFAPLPAQRLLRLIWEWDDVARRLRPRVPYEGLAVYLWWEADADAGGATMLGRRLVAAMAVNAAGAPFQFEAFGFAPLPGEQRAAEILTLFHGGGPRLSGHAFTRRFIREGCFADLRARGARVLYTTCSDRPLPTYLRMGWSLLSSTILDGEPRHQLRLRLNEHPAGPRPAGHEPGDEAP